MFGTSNKIIRGIYLKLYVEGYPEISIDMDDISKQASIFERVINEYDIEMGDVFNLTPVYEIYEVFRARVIQIFWDTSLAYTDYHNKLTICCSKEYALSELDKLKEYEEVINECVSAYKNYLVERKIKE